MVSTVKFHRLCIIFDSIKYLNWLLDLPTWGGKFPFSIFYKLVQFPLFDIRYTFSFFLIPLLLSKTWGNNKHLTANLGKISDASFKIAFSCIALAKLSGLYFGLNGWHCCFNIISLPFGNDANIYCWVSQILLVLWL